MSRLRLALLAAAGFALYSGCDDAASSNKNEPASTTLTVGGSINSTFKLRNSGNTYSIYDTSRYTFQADSGYTYTILLDGEIAIFGSVLNPAGSEAVHSSTTPRSNDWDDSISVHCYKSGTYTLLVYGPPGTDFRVRLEAKTKGVPGGYIAEDAYENDDEARTAKPLPTDGSVQRHNLHGTSAGTKDRDWLQVKCDSGKTYTFQYTDSTQDLRLSLYDTDTNSISTQTTSAYDSALKKTVYSRAIPVTKSGTYFLELYSAYDDACWYTIAAKSKDGLEGPGIADSYEFDNTLRTAKTIPSDSSVQSRTLHGTSPTSSTSNDIDWIAIECDSMMEYRIAMRDKDQIAMLAVYDRDSTLVPVADGSSSNSSSAGMSIRTSTFFAERKGTYYLRVSGNIWSAQYWLAVTKRTPSGLVFPDSYENDNTRANARTIATDSTVQTRSIHGSASSFNDIDWIAIECDTGKTYSLWIRDTLESISTQFYDTDSSKLDYTYRGTLNTSLGMVVAQRSFHVRRPGKVHVLLSSSNKALTYRVAATVAPGIVGRVLADSFESDNTLRSAKTLSVDSSVQHRTLHGLPTEFSDVDWFAIQCDTGRTYSVWYNDSLNDIAMAIYKADSTVLASTLSSTHPGGLDGALYQRSFAVPTPGIYHVRVSNSEGPCDYTIAATVEYGLPGQILPDTFEVDNTMRTAKPIDKDSSLQKRTLHRSPDSTIDVDWFSFPCDSGMVCTIFYRDKEIRAQIAVFDADSTSLDLSGGLRYSSADGMEVNYREITAPRTGTYYLRVSASLPIKYFVSVTQSFPRGYAPRDSFETDDAIADAKLIPTDSTVQARTIHGSDAKHVDIDWIAVPCDSGKTYTVDYRDTLGHLDVAVYDANETLIPGNGTYTFSSALNMNIRHFEFTPASSAKYYIRVRNTREASRYFVAVTKE